MFRRDPVRAALSRAEAVLGHEARGALSPLRAAVRRGGVLGVARGDQAAVVGLCGAPEGGLFELASVSKPFTAALASALVREGVLGWDTPTAHLGGMFRGLPASITPRALATHTAGVPPHPARAALTAFTRFQDPYGGMSARDAVRSAGRWTNARAAGRFAYSNLGVGVLALALAYAADEEPSAAGYGRALARYVTDPLELGSVTLTPDPARLVTPTATLFGGGVTGFGPLAGAGGLFGTAADLLAFGLAHVGGQAGEGWREVRRVPGLPPHVSRVAPGWFVTGGAWWHDGVARGTRTALGVRPADGAVVTLLVRGGVPLMGRRGAVAAALLGLLGGEAAMPSPAPHSGP